MSAKFGPGGNCDWFYSLGLKSTVDAPSFVRSVGLDAYEYEAGNGISGSAANFSAIGKRAFEEGIALSFHTPYFISLSGVDIEKRL